MNRCSFCELAVKKLNDNPRNSALLNHITAYIEELENEISNLQEIINSRSREDNFQKAGELIEARIDEIILQSYESI